MKKKYRSITIDDVQYAWRLKTDPIDTFDFNHCGGEASGDLVVWLNRAIWLKKLLRWKTKESITPVLVANIIRQHRDSLSQ